MEDSGFDINGAASGVADSYTLFYESDSGFTRLFTIVRDGRRFVAKALKTEYLGSSVHNDLLRKEYQIACSLYHPSIISVVGFEVLPNIGPSVIMEYVEGMTLDAYLRQKPSETVARRIAAQLCDAVSYMHGKQIVHRDLKPGNIMVSPDGACVKIIDFGLSESPSFMTLKYKGGTPEFSAPEQFTAASDYRSDIYSLGKIFSLMLPMPRYRGVISRCTDLNPDNRWPDVSTLKHRLLNVSDGTTRRRNRLLVSATVVIGITLGYIMPNLIKNKTEVAAAAAKIAEHEAVIVTHDSIESQKEMLSVKIDSLADRAAKYTLSELERAYSGEASDKDLSTLTSRIFLELDKTIERELPDSATRVQASERVREASAMTMREFFRKL